MELGRHVNPAALTASPQLALGWDEGTQLLAASGTAAAASGGGSSMDRIGWRGPFWLHALAQVAATALGLPIAVGLVVLLVWNAYLFSRNTTTIEHHEGRWRPLRGLAAGGVRRPCRTWHRTDLCCCNVFGLMLPQMCPLLVRPGSPLWFCRCRGAAPVWQWEATWPHL